MVPIEPSLVLLICMQTRPHKSLVTELDVATYFLCIYDPSLTRGFLRTGRMLPWVYIVTDGFTVLYSFVASGPDHREVYKYSKQKNG